MGLLGGTKTKTGQWATGARALEELALEEFKLGHLTRPELRRLLGFGTRAKLDDFLTAHEVFGTFERTAGRSSVRGLRAAATNAASWMRTPWWTS